MTNDSDNRRPDPLLEHPRDAERSALAVLGERTETEEREALAARVYQDGTNTVVEFDKRNVTPQETIDRGRAAVKDAYETIVAALADRRAARDAIEAEIKELVDAETLWRPIIKRLVNGPTKRGDDA